MTCTAGKDGGLQQTFILEVTDTSSQTERGAVTTLSDEAYHSSPLYRVLGETPIFRLHSLEPGREYQLQVYAVNAKGRSSPPVVLSNVRVETAAEGAPYRPPNASGKYPLDDQDLLPIRK